MATRSLLINYVGYPNEIFNFMPDNGLANLAACLLRDGHETLIWDYATADIVHKLFPYHCSEKLNDLRERILRDMRDEGQASQKDLEAFYALETEIDAFQKEKILELGREISTYVRRNKIDFVGMKLWTGAGFYGSKIIAEQLRKDNPQLFIFGGGPHIDWFHERVYDVTNAFDALAYGEGEEVIGLLAKYAEGKMRLENIPNIIYLKDGRKMLTHSKPIENLDDLPLPAYDVHVYPALHGNQKVKAILFDESRGCPNSCNFCIHPGKSGRKRRLKDPVKFVDGLEKIVKQYNFRTFRFSGSNPPSSFMRKVAEELIARGLNIRYSAYAHVRGFTKEDFRLLRKSGCCALSFGVESGSQEILDRSINKRISVQEMHKTLKSCRNAGIKITTSIIVPAPFENETTKQDTLTLLLDVRPESTIVFFPAVVLGTTWEKNRNAYGFYIENEKEFYEKMMSFRANHFAPPILWRQLPTYELNGKSFRQIGKETNEFIQLLERQGLVTQLFDQTLLLAEYCDKSAKEFSDAVHAHLLRGDAASINKIIEDLNSKITDAHMSIPRC